MATGNNIELRIAATGGDQAAAEVRKVESAVEASARVTHDHAAAASVDRLANIERAKVIAQVGEAFKVTGAFVREAADKFKEADPELSRTLGEVATGMDAMTSAATMAAQGFAVGGPLGGAIGALGGVLLPDLKAAFEDMIASLEGAAKAQENAGDMQTRLNRIYSQGVNAYHEATDAAQGYQEASDKLTQSINAEAAAMERRNKVADAKASADAADRDAADAAAIRAGRPKEDVAAERAAFDAAQAREKVQRDLDAARARQQSAADKLLDSERGVEAATNDPNISGKDREKIIAERKAARERAQKEFDRAQQEFNIANEVAPERIRAIDATQERRTGEALAEKQDRLKREAEDERKRKEKEDKDRAQRQLDAAEGNLDDLSKRRAGSILQRAGRTGNRALQGIGNRLADGTSEDELDKVSREIVQEQGKLGSANVAALKQVIAELKKQAAEVETLKAQIKSSRTGR